MLDTNIIELEAQRAAYVAKKIAADKKLKKLEDAYDSLLRFKRDVSRSQDEFASLKNSKNNILSIVEQASQNCKTAKRYHTGMQNILEGIGTKVVGATYRALLVAIQLKQHKTMEDIDEQEASISRYERKINELDVKIAEARQQAQC